MAKKFIDKTEELKNQRAGASEEVQKTKYARPGYNFVAAHSNYKDPMNV